MDKDYDVLFRIMILGDAGVGKTCLLQRFCDEEFRHSHVYTIGIDFKMKTLSIGNLKVRIQIWDTAGQERYRTITRQYYRKAQGIILAYDITDESSFLNIRKWASDASEYGDEKVQTILVGNKSDREDGRVVSYEDGEALADDYGMAFFESSAYTDSNVTELFIEIAKQVVKVHKEDIQHLQRLRSLSESELSEEEEVAQIVNGIDLAKPVNKLDNSCCCSYF